MTRTELAHSLGVSRDAVSGTARAEARRTQERLRDMIEIIERVLPWSGSELAAYAWYGSQPLPSFGDRTARDLSRRARRGGQDLSLAHRKDGGGRLDRSGGGKGPRASNSRLPRASPALVACSDFRCRRYAAWCRPLRVVLDGGNGRRSAAESATIWLHRLRQLICRAIEETGYGRFAMQGIGFLLSPTEPHPWNTR